MTNCKLKEYFKYLIKIAKDFLIGILFLVVLAYATLEMKEHFLYLCS
jgi:hypothetical protein